MQNPYITQVTSIMNEVSKSLPNGLETTMDMLLECMSKSDDKQLRDIASYIKTSDKGSEMGALFNFLMSLLKPDIAPIRETIYDRGLDGIRDLREYLTDKYGQDNKMKADMKAYDFFCWLMLKLPAKEELKKVGLILQDRDERRINI